MPCNSVHIFINQIRSAVNIPILSIVEETNSFLVNNESSKEDKLQLEEVITYLANRGVQTTLLACTDLQLIAPAHPTAAIYDTMHILVDSTVRELFS
jgi:aspartate/glutamate racemase